jgi:predicted MFS family arabinose efflux permease
VRNLFLKFRLAVDDPFRNPDIRLLFGAQGISSLGSQISHIAYPLIAIDVIHASNGAIALLEIAFLLPFVLFGIPAGALLDRRTRKPVLIATDLVRMGALLVVPFAYLTGVLSMPILIVVLFFIGTCSLLYDVAHQSYLPAILRGPQLGLANGRLMAMESATGVAGPALAGIIVARLSGPVALVVDSFSFLVSALMVQRVRHVEQAPTFTAQEVEERSLWREMREGLAWVVQHPHLRGNALAALIFNFFGGLASGPLLIAYARRELALPTELIGFVIGAGTAGIVVGTMINAKVVRLLGMGRTLVLGGIILPVMPLGFALLDRSMGVPLIAALAILTQFIAFFGAGLFHVNQVTYRQLITPARLLGRMNASMKTVMLLGLPLGALIGSVIAESLGLRATLFAGALGIVLGPLPLLTSGIARVHAQPAHTEG